jgi:hypothetical protein
MRRSLMSLLLCGAALVLPQLVLAQAPAPAVPAVDLSDLNLRIAEARDADSIKLGEATVKPEKGFKFVLITLRGELRTPGKVSASASAFYTLYSTIGPNNLEKVARADAKGVDLGSEGTYSATESATYTAPKNVLLDVAMPVPDGVTQFFILWDTAKGKQRAKVDVGRTAQRRVQ